MIGMFEVIPSNIRRLSYVLIGWILWHGINIFIINFHTRCEFRFSDWQICTTWYWRGLWPNNLLDVIAVVQIQHTTIISYTMASADSKFDDFFGSVSNLNNKNVNENVNVIDPSCCLFLIRFLQGFAEQCTWFVFSAPSSSALGVMPNRINHGNMIFTTSETCCRGTTINQHRVKKFQSLLTSTFFPGIIR